MSDVLVVNGGVAPTVKIRPPKAWSPLAVGELWKFRDLFTALAIRDVKLRYRQTALGVAWVILIPLLGTVIFTFVFGKIVGLRSPNTSYSMLVFSAMLGWQAFNSTLTKASACVVGNAQLVTKIYFPRLILPLSTVLSTLIDFAVCIPVLAGMMIWKGMVPWWGITLIPVWLFFLVLLAVGLGLYTSALMVIYRDLQYAIPILVQFLFYVSPVAYVTPKDWPRLAMLNPLTGLLEAFRWSIIPGWDIHWEYVEFSATVSVGMFVFGAFAFKRMERRFADVI